MSKFKKNTLATALVVGLAMAGSAGAYTYYTAGDTIAEKVATADVADSTTVVTMTEDIQVVVDGQDLIVGRTTGFQVRLNLFGGTSGSGSVFAADPIPTADSPALPAGWTVTLAAGGANANYAVYNVSPPSGTTSVPGIVPGQIFHVAGAQLKDVEELSTSGAVISGQMFFADPVAASEIQGSRKNINLLTSGNPVVLDCDATQGDVNSRIDVSDPNGVFNNYGYPAKTHFSPNGNLGGGYSTQFDFGNISASVDSGFGSFAYATTDEFKTVLTAEAGTDLSAFSSIYLSTDNCSSAITNGDGTISGNKVTFDYTGGDVGASGTGFTASVCGTVDGTTVIDDSLSFSETTTFTRGDATSSDTCNLLPLLYNGSVVEVYHINPAGNSTAQSFVRVINRSGTGGKVTLHGIDDQGNSGASDISFMLAAGHSMQINSEDLEHGNTAKGLTGAWGDGAGKWRAIMTAEFVGARVQGLNRNANDGTVTNLTDADGAGEQTLNTAYDNYNNLNN